MTDKRPEWEAFTPEELFAASTVAMHVNAALRYLLRLPAEGIAKPNFDAAERHLRAAKEKADAQQQEIDRLRQQAALAVEEWGQGTEEDYLDVETWGEMQHKREVCTVCSAHQEFDNIGRRPFPHRSDCRKVRYEALQQLGGR